MTTPEYCTRELIKISNSPRPAREHQADIVALVEALKEYVQDKRHIEIELDQMTNLVMRLGMELRGRKA